MSTCSVFPVWSLNTKVHFNYEDFVIWCLVMATQTFKLELGFGVFF